MSFRLGLTGSIGMGKSTTAKFFENEGCALWDADAAVHRLYAKDGKAVQQIRKAFPNVVLNGFVSRDLLKKELELTSNGFEKLEAIVHPLVAQDRETFINQSSADILVFDIPLLFETGGDKFMDAVVCVTVDSTIQKQRVLARSTMTEKQLQSILKRQMPISEKLVKSDYVIETETLEQAEQQVGAVLKDIRENRLNA